MKHGPLFFFFFFLIYVPAFSQSNADLLKLGNIYFENGNYASAAYFYHKILMGGSSGIREVVYPYEFKNYSKPLIEEKKSEGQKNDSLKINPDTTIKSSIVKTDDSQTVQIKTKTVPEDTFILHPITISNSSLKILTDTLRKKLTEEQIQTILRGEEVILFDTFPQTENNFISEKINTKETPDVRQIKVVNQNLQTLSEQLRKQFNTEIVEKILHGEDIVLQDTLKQTKTIEITEKKISSKDSIILQSITVSIENLNSLDDEIKKKISPDMIDKILDGEKIILTDTLKQTIQIEIPETKTVMKDTLIIHPITVSNSSLKILTDTHRKNLTDEQIQAILRGEEVIISDTLQNTEKTIISKEETITKDAPVIHQINVVNKELQMLPEKLRKQFTPEIIEKILHGEDIIVMDTLKQTKEIQKTEVKTNNSDGAIRIPLGTETNVEILYVMNRLAESYRLSYNYDNAEIWYGKLAAAKSSEYPQAAYWYANSLLKNSKYEEAITAATDFLLENPDKNSDYIIKTEKDIKNASFAENAISKSNEKIIVEKADSAANSTGSNFAMIYGKEGSVFYTSSRSTTILKDGSSQMQCDIYNANFNDKELSEIRKLPSSINSSDNEGAPVLSPDKTKLYFTRWNNDKKNPECVIYISKFLNGQWLTPKKLSDEVNREGFISMHPALSPDGTTLFFSSDRPGGKGKMDLWQCTIDEFDNISEVMNLGKPINTPENEVTPFFHEESNTFFFSSDGHTGMGGLDIFQTLPDNNFSAPIENMGHPINSSRDDAYYIADENLQNGFFSSDRDGCADCNSGSCYSIYRFSGEQMKITMSGKVFNSETKQIIPNTLVYFTEVKERIEPVSAFTDDDGNYSIVLRKDLEFYITAQKIKFFKDATSKNTLGIEQTTHLTHDFFLKPIPQGDIEIPGIEYDYDKATLRPRSKNILDTLVDFLTLNDNLIVEINSHTDERGNDDYNMNLSEARAQSCVDYLIEKGISIERLVPKGYGESKPLIVNAKKEEEHQRNRRTAFRILSEDYKPVKKSQFIKTDE